MMVADTDVLIDFLSGKEPGAGRVALELEHAQLRTTAITRVELLVGARSAKQLAAVRELLAAIPTLPLDEAAADRAAAVRRDLDAEGEAIGMADALIAGIVMANGAMLLTRNARHFRRVRGLALSLLAEGE